MEMLATLKEPLFDSSFNAWVWAMAACAFLGMTRIGEATVRSRKMYNTNLHATQGFIPRGHGNKGTPYVQIGLPKATSVHS